jgi:hypothetical protein
MGNLPSPLMYVCSFSSFFLENAQFVIPFFVGKKEDGKQAETKASPEEDLVSEGTLSNQKEDDESEEEVEEKVYIIIAF